MKEKILGQSVVLLSCFGCVALLYGLFIVTHEELITFFENTHKKNNYFMSIFKIGTKKAIVFTLCFFLFVAITYYYIDRKSEEIESKVEIAAVVTGFEKYERVFRIKLFDGEKKISVLDYSFKSYKNSIKIGDSLIKRKETTCYQYKRNGKIIEENCDGIFLEIE